MSATARTSSGPAGSPHRPGCQLSGTARPPRPARRTRAAKSRSAEHPGCPEPMATGVRLGWLGEHTNEHNEVPHFPCSLSACCASSSQQISVPKAVRYQGHTASLIYHMLPWYAIMPKPLSGEHSEHRCQQQPQAQTYTTQPSPISRLSQGARNFVDQGAPS